MREIFIPVSCPHHPEEETILNQCKVCNPILHFKYFDNTNDGTHYKAKYDPLKNAETILEIENGVCIKDLIGGGRVDRPPDNHNNENDINEDDFGQDDLEDGDEDEESGELGRAPAVEDEGEENEKGGERR